MTKNSARNRFNRKLALRTIPLICLILFIFHVPICYSLQTTVYIDPPTITATVGQTFDISINISDVVDLYGWEFKLKWDSSVLDVLNVTEGEFLNSSGDTYFYPIINNTLGCILVDCTLVGAIPGVNGSGRLASLKFEVEQMGETVLDLNDTKLLNSQEQSIDHQSEDGIFTTPGHDVAVVEVIASPITVTPGETVHINVTVQNQGDYIELFNVTAYYSSEAIDIQPVTLNATKSTDLRFEWNTTGATKGDYIISAEASTVTNETDTTDNVKASDNSVTVLHSGHDIAIVKVNPSKTVVGQGHSLYINVTCKNYGTFTETCNVTAYYNKTAITQSDGKNPTTLSSGDSTTFTIHWNTTGVAKGNYTISAYAVPVPNETDTADNTYIDGEVWVKWPYDVTGDNYCGIDDIVAIAEHFGQDPDSADWNPIYDINCDDYVGIDDIVETAEHFGETDQ